MPVPQVPPSRKALVTGGTRGIGLATAEALRAGGYLVRVTGRSSAGLVPPDFVADFEDDEDLLRVQEWIHQEKFDVLVNNVGTNKLTAFSELRTREFEKIQKVNVVGTFMVTQAALPHMSSSGWGRVINLGSILGLVSLPGRVAYSTSKAALLGFTRALAIEYAASGITFNCVAPGFIDTDLTREILGSEGIAHLEARIPLRHLGSSSSVAALVMFLASESASYVTGQCLYIDGGYTST